MTVPRDTLDAYVHAALALHGYRLDAAQTAAVVEQFARIAALAQIVGDAPLTLHAEPLPVFRPR